MSVTQKPPTKVGYPTQKPPVRGGYEEVETLSDPGGTIAIISRRVGYNLYTAAFFRVYTREGQPERTSFFAPKDLDSLERMIATTRARILELESGSVNKAR